MSTDSEESRPGSAADSTRNETSSQSDADWEQQTTIYAKPTQIKESTIQPKSLLAEDPFRTEKSKRLFEAIDELRRCGAGQDLELPQLLIVGKQSVGKSSLLQSLTDIPFPVGDELCTRFATRIISKRTAPETADIIRVFIEKGDVDPFGDSEDGDQSIPLEFPEDQKAMSAEYFRELVDKASAAMGVSDGKSEGRNNFSSRVLKIELSGPRRSHFAILDLPGIFGAATGPITNRDREGVDKMVIAYMRKPENIIVCVADAVDNLANQRILSLAADHADEERIVGVFTKCDMTDNPERIVSIVQNSEATTGRSLRHGWFVIQNRGHKDDPSSFDREKAERLTFSKDPWLQIEEKRRGTANLKTFLSNLLCRRIQEGFPGMELAVEKRLDQQWKILNRLGKPRSNPALQRSYLSDIAQRFQRLADQALKTPEDLPRDDMKLRGKVETAKKEFASTLRQRGHLYAFSNIQETAEESAVGSGEDHTIYSEIRAQISKNKGMELEGMVNPAVLKPLLRMQTTPWSEIAEKHLEKLASETRDVVLLLLKDACDQSDAAPYTFQALKRKVLKFSTDARTRAMERLKTFRLEEEYQHLQTNNPAFHENVKEAQLLRFKAALKRYEIKNPPYRFMLQLAPGKPDSIKTIPPAWKSWVIIDPDNVDALFRELHSHTEKNTEDEIHDLLKAYYEVVREDFITYVNSHIAEPFLHDNEGAVRGFSITSINNLSDEEVEELGAEHDSTVIERRMVEATIKRLESAKQTLKQTSKKMRAL